MALLVSRPAVLGLLAFALGLPAPGGAVDVDLATFPDTSDPVPEGTVLADQWRAIGILFSARVDGGTVEPIQQYFGQSFGHLFFSPDVPGAVAEFEFVEPGTDTPTDVASFQLTGGFMPGEASQLVGFDEFGAVVDEFATDGTANGDVILSIEGAIRTAEWRTMGNPGIACKDLAFEPVPEPRGVALLLVGGTLLAGAARRHARAGAVLR